MSPLRKLAVALWAAVFVFGGILAGRYWGQSNVPPAASTATEPRPAVPTPTRLPPITLKDLREQSRSLTDWPNRTLLINFWATWCAPCRKELPALDALNRDLGGDRFRVVTIATGRNTLPAITRLFDETGVESLPLLLDPKQGLAHNMGVMGLPVSVILDPEGREIARMTGDADWNGASARAIVAALLE